MKFFKEDKIYSTLLADALPDGGGLRWPLHIRPSFPANREAPTSKVHMPSSANHRQLVEGSVKTRPQSPPRLPALPGLGPVTFMAPRGGFALLQAAVGRGGICPRRSPQCARGEREVALHSCETLRSSVAPRVAPRYVSCSLTRRDSSTEDLLRNG